MTRQGDITLTSRSHMHEQLFSLQMKQSERKNGFNVLYVQSFKPPKDNADVQKFKKKLSLLQCFKYPMST